MSRTRLRDDPATPSLSLFALLVLAGFAVIALAWSSAKAHIPAVYAQIPVLISGAIGGTTLIVVGTALMHVQYRRRLDAQEQHINEAILQELAALNRAAHTKRAP